MLKYFEDMQEEKVGEIDLTNVEISKKVQSVCHAITVMSDQEVDCLMRGGIAGNGVKKFCAVFKAIKKDATNLLEKCGLEEIQDFQDEPGRQPGEFMCSQGN